MHALLRLSHQIDRATRGMGRVLIWLTLLMVAVSTWNAIGAFLGKMFHRVLTTNALQELSWYLFSLLFLFGGAWALLEHAHVRVDVFFERLSPRAREVIVIASMALLVIPFALAMLATCWPFVLESIRTLEVSPDPGGLPRWPLKACVPISFTWLLAQAVSELIKGVDRLRRGGVL